MAQPSWRAYLRNGDYQIIGELDAWLSLSLVLRFNATGSWALEVANTTDTARLLTRTSGIVVRCDNKTVFSGPVGTELVKTWRTLSLSGPDDNILLEEPARPTPAQASGPYPDAYDVRTGVASTIMWDYVNANLASSAPPGCRIPALYLGPNPFLGGVLTGRANFQSLHALLGGIAVHPVAGGLGYRIIQSDADLTRLVFNIWQPVNRTAEARFGVQAGTAQDYEDAWSFPDANYWVVMGGDGFGTNRTIAEGGDAASLAEVGRRITGVYDARGITDTGELHQKLAELLAGAVTSRKTTVQPFEVPSLEFGTDWNFGDIVTVIVDGVETAEIVRDVEIELTADRGAIVTPMIGMAGSSNDERASAHLKSVRDRVTNLELNWGVPPDSIDSSMLMANSVGPSELQANAVTEPKLDVLDAPLDNDILTYDASGRLEWQAINALAANLSIVSLTASGNVTGARLISTVSTGTAPFGVGSSTVVAGLNADLVDGQHGPFATAADLALYVAKAGDTMTGALTIHGAGGGNDQVLFLQHGTGDGVVSLGATNSPTPDLIIKNGIGTQMASLTNAGLLLVGANIAVGTAAHGDAVMCNLWLVEGVNYRRLMVTGTSFQISRNADGLAATLTIDAAGLMTIQALEVDGAADFHANVDITAGGLGVSGASIFRNALTVQGGLTVQTGSLTVSAGGLSVNAASVFSNALTVQGGLTVQTGNHTVQNGNLTVQAGNLSVSAGGLSVNGGSLFSSVVNMVPGSPSGFARSAWDGYILMAHNGTQVEVPYHTH